MNETCSRCATVVDAKRDGDPPLAWAAERVPGPAGAQLIWTCAPCTRRHVRAIEAKLDQQWW